MVVVVGWVVGKQNEEMPIVAVVVVEVGGKQLQIVVERVEQVKSNQRQLVDLHFLSIVVAVGLLDSLQQVPC